MTFQKGHSGNPNGRPKGSPNKVSGELRKAISDFLTDNFASVQETWEKANERERLQFYVQLLRFALPTLQSMELQSDFERMTDSELQMIIKELKEQQI